MPAKVSPSLLSADFMKLAEDIETVSTADMLHLDVMDGVFVPPITFGADIVGQIRKITGMTLDVHLMVSKPEEQIPLFIAAGADMVTFHYEATAHPHRLIQVIKAAGKVAGISINPGTPVSVLEDLIEEIDMVLIMSVNPGWGGQKFIERATEKVRILRKMANEKNPGLYIMVDGGVNDKIAPVLSEAGANMFVAGSYVFKSEDREAAIKSLRV